MIDLNNIKTILQVAGISRLQIQFDDKQQLVNVEYVFRGKPDTTQVTYQEIIDHLSIGRPLPSVAPQVDGCFELKDLPGETLNNGLDRT